jgi:hypothetical protein
LAGHRVRAVSGRYPTGAAFDLADLYRGFHCGAKLADLEVTNRFYEIGSAAGIEATERYLTNQRAADELR